MSPLAPRPYQVLPSGKRRFGSLLTALLLYLAGVSLLGQLRGYLSTTLLSLVLVVLFAGVLTGAVLNVTGDPNHRRLFLMRLAVFLAVAMKAIGQFRGLPQLDYAALAFAVIAITYTVVMVLRFLVRVEQVDAETICAALCVFLLLGVLWSELYAMAERLQPNSFSVNSGTSAEVFQTNSFGSLYFSYVTLTTLGYGDISPIRELARLLTVSEALVGQIYLVVLVARLVGINVSQSLERKNRAPNRP